MQGDAREPTFQLEANEVGVETLNLGDGLVDGLSVDDDAIIAETVVGGSVCSPANGGGLSS